MRRELSRKRVQGEAARRARPGPVRLGDPESRPRPAASLAAMDEDLVLALQLQEEWDLQVSRHDQAREPLSLVDASWELVDPTPDLRALFVQFNDRFFWGKLEAVEVKWSMRMTLRRTLLSAFTGPPGTAPRDARVYHTFHDEVDEYRRHWWRCDGPCQHRGPYYGFVRRATNRAPSAHDYWWAEHQQTCGGAFVKIKEPENYSRKGQGRARLGRQPAPTAEERGQVARVPLA
ncbi:hypothetical protein CB1_000692018 [Camelus ferus]|nr:hypothetical protein CB1_000692018 [Camelus ferus]